MLFVAPVLVGGFGNRVFTLWAALHYAIKTKRKFVLIKDHIDKSHHEPDKDVLNYLETLFFPFTYFYGDYKSWEIFEETPQTEFMYIKPPIFEGHSVLFKGYFQNPQYFPDTPYKPIRYKKIYKNTYFLHIRLGDYKTHDHFQIPIIPYYNLAIRSIQKNDKNARFLIFSNENNLAEDFIKKNIKEAFQYEFSKARTSYETLYEMSCCVGAVCANSSLSWLGAYYQSLPRTQIYMPRPWIKTHLNADIYPTWVNIIDTNEKGADIVTKSKQSMVNLGVLITTN